MFPCLKAPAGQEIEIPFAVAVNGIAFQLFRTAYRFEGLGIAYLRSMHRHPVNRHTDLGMGGGDHKHIADTQGDRPGRGQTAHPQHGPADKPHVPRSPVSYIRRNTRLPANICSDCAGNCLPHIKSQCHKALGSPG